MNISDAGLALIKDVEGCVLTAYPDPATGGDPWTIGVGHTGPDVSPGIAITEDQATELLRKDVESASEAVNEAVTVSLTQPQFDALCSFVFNVGATAFHNSTMLRLLNAGRYMDAANQFGVWIKAAGKTMQGLVNRRVKEKAMFMSGTVNQ